jgi:hypothetical protein
MLLKKTLAIQPQLNLEVLYMYEHYAQLDCISHNAVALLLSAGLIRYHYPPPAEFEYSVQAPDLLRL